MRRRPGVTLGSVALALAMSVASGPALAETAPTPLPVGVVSAALAAAGTVLRSEGPVSVVRIPLPARLGSSAGAPNSVYRVRVAGNYPPRALRYVVLAGGRPVGYGIPTVNEHAVQAITTDASVLTAPITVRYGDGAPGDSAAPGATTGASTSAASAVQTHHHIPNPATPGPFQVATRTYDLGEQAYQPPGLSGSVELTANVHYPKGLADGPYPIVLFMHGNHSSCYKGKHTDFRWPCKPGWTPMPSYLGYNYIAGPLASYGFIVVSVSANGVNVLGEQVGDTGMTQRGELLEKHLDLWHTWSTTGGGPFGSKFVGKVDFSKIGVMGHSRGGEGAINQVIVDRKRAHPYGTDAVLALAPVDFDRKTVNDVPLAVVLPYCDGDVSDLEGVHYFDDARYRVPGDPTPKDTVTVMGANHNFFNTVWSPGNGYPGAFDDQRYFGNPPCSGKLSQDQERGAGAAYVVGFFRRYLGGGANLDPMWTGAASPSGIGSVKTRISYMAPGLSGDRLDLERATSKKSLRRDSLGGRVTRHDMSRFDWCPETRRHPCLDGPFGYNDPHQPGLPRDELGWSKGSASLRYSIPTPDRDVHRYDALQFRTAVNPSFPANRDVDVQDLSVQLGDANGHVASVKASDVGNAALVNPFSKKDSWHLLLNQVRFPLRRFRHMNLHRIRWVQLRFDQRHHGEIDISDMAFTREDPTT